MHALLHEIQIICLLPPDKSPPLGGVTVPITGREERLQQLGTTLAVHLSILERG